MNCLKDAALSPVVSGCLYVFVSWPLFFKDFYRSGSNVAIPVGIVWLVNYFSDPVEGLTVQAWDNVVEPQLVICNFNLRRIWTRYG